MQPAEAGDKTVPYSAGVPSHLRLVSVAVPKRSPGAFNGGFPGEPLFGSVAAANARMARHHILSEFQPLVPLNPNPCPLGWSLPFKGRVRLEETAMDVLAFGNLGLLGLPSTLNLHPLPQRPVGVFNAVVVVGMGLPCPPSLLPTPALTFLPIEPRLEDARSACARRCTPSILQRVRACRGQSGLLGRGSQGNHMSRPDR